MNLLISQNKSIRALTNFLLIILSVAILLTALEISLRIWHKVKKGIPFFARTEFLIGDPLLGWSGSQFWGDLNTKKFKILVIGDSFTQSGPETEQQQYFSVVKKKLNAEIFVYGGSGYGTLQEFMLVDKYLDEVKPDLIILQVCSNDFINNSWELERRSFIHNNYTVRPYYENGRVLYCYPKGPRFIRQYLVPNSRLAYYIAVMVDKILAKMADQGKIVTIEKMIEEGNDFGLFEQSVMATDELIGKIKIRSGRVPVIAFSPFNNQPYFGQFKRIFQKHGIEFLDQMPAISWAAEGRDVPDNAHWESKGHEACGKYLAEYIRKKRLTRISK